MKKVCKRVTKFIFTWNNYNRDSKRVIDWFVEDACDWAIVGFEIAPTTGTRHLQGYLHMNKQMSLKKVRGIFQGADVRIAKGSSKQNFDYCSKSGNFTEYGDRPWEKPTFNKKCRVFRKVNYFQLINFEAKQDISLTDPQKAYIYDHLVGCGHCLACRTYSRGYFLY